MKGKELTVINKNEKKEISIFEVIKGLILGATSLFLIACGCAMVYAFFLIVRG